MITQPAEKDFPVIIELWELSVRASHDFLPEDYLQKIKSLLPSILRQVQLFVDLDKDNTITGFIGIAEKKIEMLFIHPQWRGQGIGRKLTEFAIDHQEIYKVDVNEQNEQAVRFYKKMGFSIIGRSEFDSLGKPFPLLQMELS